MDVFFDIFDTLYVNESKDATFGTKEMNATSCMRNSVRDHQKVVVEPEEINLFHVSAEAGNGQPIAKAIHEVIKDKTKIMIKH